MKQPIYINLKDNSKIMIVDSSNDPIEDIVLYHCVELKGNGKAKGGIFYLYQNDLDNDYKEETNV